MRREALHEEGNGLVPLVIPWERPPFHFSAALIVRVDCVEDVALHPKEAEGAQSAAPASLHLHTRSARDGRMEAIAGVTSAA